MSAEAAVVPDAVFPEEVSPAQALLLLQSEHFQQALFQVEGQPDHHKQVAVHSAVTQIP